jgi:hypothetical protein
MKLKTLKGLLRENADRPLLFVLPDGDPIPPDFHITEVGHVVKNFVDCGGSVRSTATCVLQAWNAANDPDHRLTAGKLASILELAGAVVPSEDLEVEIEYEGCRISQYPLVDGGMEDGTLKFTLAGKHTDCLAKEACGLESSASEGGSCCG